MSKYFKKLQNKINKENIQDYDIVFISSVDRYAKIQIRKNENNEMIAKNMQSRAEFILNDNIDVYETNEINEKIVNDYFKNIRLIKAIKSIKLDKIDNSKLEKISKILNIKNI